jgi:hypothetical protein
MNTKFLKQFEKYFNGEMEPEEKASFEESLQKDPELNAAYAEYLSIYDAIGDKDLLELRIKLKEILNENARKKDAPDFFMQGYNWLWMAALITIMISFTVIISLIITRSDKDDQFASEISVPGSNGYNTLDKELKRFEQRNVDFKLELPKDPISFNRKDPLLFKWTVNSTNPLILDLIDMEGQVIFSSGRAIESPYLVIKKLPNGMLVYRFRTETESYYMGFLYLK